MKIVAALIVAFVVVCAVSVARGAECHGHPSGGTPNLNPIQDQPPVLVREWVANSSEPSGARGKLYTVGTGDEAIPLVHVWGNSYEMGYAVGVLLKDKVTGFMPDVWEYMMEQVEESQYVSKLPKWLQVWIADLGLDAALDLTEVAVGPWIGKYFFDEVRGMHDATGLDYKTCVRIHLIGSLTQGKCSMFGAWGKAVEHAGTDLLQLRALDWDTKGPFKNYPALVVYHPDESTGMHAWMNIGWAGWAASITGISSQQVAISEIGVDYPDASFGAESRIGYPFPFMLRDILQYDKTIVEGLTRIQKGPRTCDLLLGVGDGKSSSFRGAAVSAKTCNIYEDTNLEPQMNGSHPRIENVVYWGMDWLCPGYDIVLAQQLQQYYGNISAENAVHHIVPMTETGDLHAAVYDLTNMKVYIANAAAEGESGPLEAYKRPFVGIDMKAVFAEPDPAGQSAHLRDMA